MRPEPEPTADETRLKERQNVQKKSNAENRTAKLVLWDRFPMSGQILALARQYSDRVLKGTEWWLQQERSARIKDSCRPKCARSLSRASYSLASIMDSVISVQHRVVQEKWKQNWRRFWGKWQQNSVLDLEDKIRSRRHNKIV